MRPQAPMEETESTGFADYVRRWLGRLQDWLAPDPADRPIVRILKLAGKSVVLLLLIAVSPVVLLIMLFVFFAAV